MRSEDPWHVSAVAGEFMRVAWRIEELLLFSRMQKQSWQSLNKAQCWRPSPSHCSRRHVIVVVEAHGTTCLTRAHAWAKHAISTNIFVVWHPANEEKTAGRAGQGHEGKPVGTSQKLGIHPEQQASFGRPVRTSPELKPTRQSRLLETLMERL